MSTFLVPLVLKAFVVFVVGSRSLLLMVLVKERTTIPCSIAKDIIELKMVVKYTTIHLKLLIISIEAIYICHSWCLMGVGGAYVACFATVLNHG